MGDLKGTYDAYVVQGAQSATSLSNKNFAKLCKDCKIVDGKKITNADIDITFSKHKTKGQQTITFDQFKAVMRELGAKRYGKGEEDQIFSLVEGKSPLAIGVTTTSKTGGVDHFTDSSQYTGMHKERFDKEGKGKGIEGRAERADYSGYVSGYKSQGTYDSKQ